MWFTVTPVYYRGRLAEDEPLTDARPQQGQPLIVSTMNELRRRWIRFASLRKDGRQGVNIRLLPDLLDVQIVAMSPL